MKKLKIAVIDKAPSKVRYSDYFKFEYDLFHMSSVPITKLLKKDVDIDIDVELYDLVVLVGSEAAKEFAKVTSVTNYAGLLLDNKFVCISNPAILVFKPEGKQDFNRALDKLHTITANLDTIQQSISDDNFKGIDNPEEALAFLKEVLTSDAYHVALDTEGTALYPRDGYVLGVSITHMPNMGRYILTDVMYDEHLDILQQIIEKFTIVMHNCKYDVKMMQYHLGLDFTKCKLLEDTMVMHYALDENAVHGLKPLAIKHTNYGDYDKALETFKNNYCKQHGMLLEDFTYDLIPFDVISVYAAKDTGVTYELYLTFSNALSKNASIYNMYRSVLMPGVMFLNDVEEVGIPIDKGRMAAAEKYLDERILDANHILFSDPVVQEFQVEQEAPFNPNSVMQLRKLLFDKKGLQPTGQKTATGADSTDADVLTELSTLDPLPGKILEIRKLTKLKNTYINKILPELDRDSRIRTNFNITFTTSGRLSSSGKFNAQQIPRDDPIIKGCIVAPNGYKIVSQD